MKDMPAITCAPSLAGSVGSSIYSTIYLLIRVVSEAPMQISVWVLKPAERRLVSRSIPMRPPQSTAHTSLEMIPGRPTPRSISMNSEYVMMRRPPYSGSSTEMTPSMTATSAMMPLCCRLSERCISMTAFGVSFARFLILVISMS